MSRKFNWDRPFKLLVTEPPPFRKGDLIKAESYINNSLIVVKVYKNTLWRKFLVWLHIAKPIVHGTTLMKVRNH